MDPQEILKWNAIVDNASGAAKRAAAVVERGDDRWEDALGGLVASGDVPAEPVADERTRCGPLGYEVLDDDGVWKLRSSLPRDWSPGR